MESQIGGTCEGCEYTFAKVYDDNKRLIDTIKLLRLNNPQVEISSLYIYPISAPIVEMSIFSMKVNVLLRAKKQGQGLLRFIKELFYITPCV